MGMLIFILFIIQFILIFAVIILFTRQNRLIELEKKQQQIQADSEEMLSVFLMELKEENEQFISKVSAIPNEEFGLTTDFQSPLEEEQHVGSDGPKIDSEAYSRLLTEQLYSKPLNDMTGQTEDFIENKSLVDKVEYFHKKGLSVQEIAKKLGKGQTEIQLMLKFHVE